MFSIFYSIHSGLRLIFLIYGHLWGKGMKAPKFMINNNAFKSLKISFKKCQLVLQKEY
jgi:hypothetical protein